MSAPPPAKRRKLSVSSTATTASHISEEDSNQPDSVPASSSKRPISPPLLIRRNMPSTFPAPPPDARMAAQAIDDHNADRKARGDALKAAQVSDADMIPRILPSPVQLTRVEGLAENCNIDTASLHDILRDPLMKHCWAFNYLFNVPWMLSHFDPDVRDQIKIHLVHGFWRRDDPHKAYIDEVTQKHANIKSIAAYLPEPFGTHHSKMFILFKHDDTAQVVILTANMREGDWKMAQAVWRSPPLLLLHRQTILEDPAGPMGSGTRFKADLLAYLRSYESRLPSLTEELVKYDFSAIRAALVASVPGRQNVYDGDTQTFFGWPGLAKVLKQVPTTSTRPRIVSQVSSVGTLGVKDTWLRETLHSTLAKSRSPLAVNANHAIVFPTANEIRHTHEGYDCGSSIHFKTQTPTNQKQVAYMRPMLCHWTSDAAQEIDVEKDAGRSRAGPHIKTYIRFADSTMTSIDWAMVTSANLSKQAWGDTKAGDGTVRVCSYEIGVVVWPQLFAQGEEPIKMVPTFKADTPSQGPDGMDVIGFRMPYSLPLIPYSGSENPWCCRMSNAEPDVHGRTWPGL